ncbi:MAG: MFS transporter [Thermodesulfobacteriota bacterium]
MKISRTRHLFRALRSRNYRLFVAGQGVSLLGTWMQQVAMSWLVYRLTGSALLLGVVGFTSQIPAFFVSPLAGVLADRWDRRRLLLLTQTLAMLQAAFLAMVVLAGVVQVWHLVVLSLLLGLVNAADIPIRQSFLVEMIEGPENLGNAIALNSSMVNAARLIGPAVAGLVVASVGEGICFIANSISYLAVIVALAAMRITPRPRPSSRRHLFHELREGFQYAFGFAPIRSILLLIAQTSLLGMPYAVLVPLFAREILHGDAHTFGFLMGAAGGGALAGTFYLASRASVVGLERVIVRADLLFAGGLALFALSGNLFLSLAALVMVGFGGMTFVASCNTMLQTILDEDKRGRVMSLFTMSFIGMVPIGSLGAGTVAGLIGPRQTLLAGAAACLVGAVLFSRQLPLLREKLRPIYRRKGMLVEAGRHARQER